MIHVVSKVVMFLISTDHFLLRYLVAPEGVVFIVLQNTVYLAFFSVILGRRTAWMFSLHSKRKMEGEREAVSTACSAPGGEWFCSSCCLWQRYQPIPGSWRTNTREQRRPYRRELLRRLVDCSCPCGEVGEYDPRGTEVLLEMSGSWNRGGYSGVKRIGMTVGNPRKLPWKIPSHKNLRTLKHAPWSKMNLKIRINRSLLKKRVQKSCTRDNSKFLYPNKYRFYYFNRFRLNNPQKPVLNRRLQPLKYTTINPIIRI